SDLPSFSPPHCRPAWLTWNRACLAVRPSPASTAQPPGWAGRSRHSPDSGRALAEPAASAAAPAAQEKENLKKRPAPPRLRLLPSYKDRPSMHHPKSAVAYAARKLLPF